MPFKPPCESGKSCYWQGKSVCYAVHTIHELSGMRVPRHPLRVDVDEETCNREFIANADGSKRNIVAMKSRAREKEIAGQGRLI